MTHKNNFAALRLFAAMLVLISHSWPLTGRPVDPVMAMTSNHLTGGTLGVMMFFAMSGFLVTESYLRRDSLTSFFEARVLRLFPALAAALAIGILIGASVTTLSASEFFSRSQTWQFFAKNMLLDLRYELPGVFVDAPYPKVVNGSLWTLPTEWFMYCVVALLGVLAILRDKTAASAVLVVVIVGLYVSPDSVRTLPFNIPPAMALCMQAFIVGMLFQLYKERMRWTTIWVVVLCALAILKAHRPVLGQFTIMIAVSYTTLWFALASPIKLYLADAWGDPSYGLYVYAFPVQQALVFTMPDVSPGKLAMLSAFATLVVAYASWWSIEKPALAQRGKLLSRWNGMKPDTQ